MSIKSLHIQFERKKLGDEELLRFYKELLVPRLIEEKMLLLLRQGKISKWFSGIGQEATSVGAALAMEQDEYILPMHRNLGIFTTRNVPLERLFAQFQGKHLGFTKGRDRSFHFGSKEHHIVGMISHLGPQMGVADGIALANKLDGNGKAVLVFCGDGGSSQGDFHEALNVAAVWELPVIFLVENNGYGLSTPSQEQFRFKSFTEKGPGYGIQSTSVDGNNVLDVYRAIKAAKETILKKSQPILIEACSFRMRGHEEASGTKYVPQELLDKWSLKDPVSNFELFLKKNGILDEKEASLIKDGIKKRIQEGLGSAFQAPLPVANTEEELNDVFYPYNFTEAPKKSEKTTTKRLVDAVSDALRQSMQKYPEMVIMGQDIAEYGGVFKVTEGFVEEFGKDRVRNTPLCESAIVGAALGLAIAGRKSVVEMQFADFVSTGFTQIVNNLAKTHYRWGQKADVVIRMPTGAGVGAGPFHSQSTEAWFFHTPGLKIFYPSTPYEAKGLLNAAIEDPNPVMFFEHKALYRAISEEVLDEYYTIMPGKGRVVQQGTDISVITYGMGVHWALKVSKELDNMSIQIIDLRTLLPWDKRLVKDSVIKTGKALVLHEDTLCGGIGGEISAWVGEHCFQYLDAPVMRLASLDTPVPFSPDLEANFLPERRLVEKIKELAGF